MIKNRQQISFETLNVMEFICKSMGIHILKLHKRLQVLSGFAAILSDTADLIDMHSLALDMLRDVIAGDLFDKVPTLDALDARAK